MPDPQSHSPRRLSDPQGWVIYLSESEVRRLVVFVHGFGGHPVDTWKRFHESGESGAWWRESDLLFVKYDSLRENITGVASRLRRELPRFLPGPLLELIEADGQRLRQQLGRYDEVFLVGHSLGGVVVRRALVDAAQDWLDKRTADATSLKPGLLKASLRLFSPASAGFRAAGPLGILKAAPGWFGLEMFLRRASAFTDLQPDSPLLAATRSRTERLVDLHPDHCGALRASILWANPDNIVLAERYETDFVETVADGASHVSVCKPNDEYPQPWTFVERGTC